MYKTGWIILGIFYVAAGLNHFIDPAFYLPLIPPYIPYPDSVNVLSGLAEIAAGIMVLRQTTRKAGAWLIILLLIVFIPAHIYFIKVDSCISSLCVSPWIGWLRLVVVHPLLILWAWFYKKHPAGG